MDILDIIGVGAELRGRIGRAFALAGILLIVGWTQRWPVAYPLVQAVYEHRVEQLTESILSGLPRQSSS